jgi:hypothetical protein
MTDYEKQCIEAQRKLTEEMKVPCFAPSNGVCWKCGHHVFGEGDWQYNLERAGKDFMTGCPNPKCSISYCD